MSLLNKLIISTLPLVPKPVVGLVASRYIAGEDLQDALQVTQNLNSRKIMATIDLLGEDILDRSHATATREICKEILLAIGREGLDSNLSLKLTQLGLKIDKRFCEDNLREILQLAREKQNFVRIDMEDHTCTEATLEIYENVRKDFANVGVAIQSYLRRSEADVQELAKSKANIRLCKGIYNEPETVAFKRREEIQENFLRLLTIMIRNRCYVGIATHDDFLIASAYQLISESNLSRDEYEFQMLLGVREKLLTRVLRNGHRARVYVPYGTEWYSYSLRRLKENPEIAGYIFKALFRRDGIK